ncbi:NUDIX hydrolase [Vallitalea pronyensis]|uniref:NUDIX hydrolase n=1 Tax=Vallitalea pronyensis TaxID=1348613 RepID=A0A8J8MME0_9FIRM|nr:NUDIX hydrolase [Vallitalea pronyensis]QUI24112.1 NUDIX hydrolase [Vallitalea pronyensis]
MIKLRTCATAFIFNSDKVLMMKRDEKRAFAPGIWAAIGGHLEQEELNLPKVACLREIEEETGLREEHLSNLELKYIVFRRHDLEMRIQYIYFGHTDKTNVIECNEGELYWVDVCGDLFQKKMTFTTRTTLEHYFKNKKNKKDNKIILGSVTTKNNVPIMNWQHIDDWRGESLLG